MKGVGIVLQTEVTQGKGSCDIQVPFLRLRLESRDINEDAVHKKSKFNTQHRKGSRNNEDA